MAEPIEGELPVDSVMSPTWKRPDEVMKLHRLKQKKKALQARMNKTDLPQAVRKSFFNVENETVSEKRRNPFR